MRRPFLLPPLALVTVLALTAPAAVAQPAAARRVPTVDDLLALAQVGSATISPDGAWVAYTQTESDFEQDAFVTHLWLVRASGGAPFQLTRGPKSAGSIAL